MDSIAEIEFLLLIGTALAILLIAFIVLVVALYRRAQMRLILSRKTFEQNILQTEVEIREETLSRVSKDLHDNLGQIASLIKINLNLLSKDISESDRIRITESKELLQKLIGDIRLLSSSLAAENLAKQGLAKQMQLDLERIERSGMIKVHFKSSTAHFAIKPEERVFLYRMFQEMLNNSLKHAQAQNLFLSIEQNDQVLRLNFKDDGVGMPPEKLNPTARGLSGNGLLNIKERCALIGAKCIIESNPGQGTSFNIVLHGKS